MSGFKEAYKHWRVTDDTVFITTLKGSQYLYLLEGRERALLIDTGWGYGRIREYVERLTDLPLLVVNTHGHPDHAGGNAWWPEVHMHEYAASPQAGEPETPVQPWLPYPDYARILIREGFVFDLGGREVEVIEIPAHSAGSIALLDRNRGLLFTGDEVESAQVLLFDYARGGISLAKEKAKKHLENMLKLQARASEFAFVCPSHNGAPISPSYVGDFVALDRAILEDRAQVSSVLHHWYLSRLPFASELRRATWGKASVIFRV